MDIESHESAMLLKESSSRRRQGLALKLAVLLCGLALLVNLNGPTDTNIGVTFSSNKEGKKVAAAAGISSTSRPASTMNMLDWREAAVAAPAWSVEDHDTGRAPFGYCARGGGFRMMSMQGKEGVPVIVPARGAKWAFSEIYGRLAALQAAGAAPVIQAWLAGELPLTSFP